jgi:hypothetical protein
MVGKRKKGTPRAPAHPQPRAIFETHPGGTLTRQKTSLTVGARISSRSLPDTCATAPVAANKNETQRTSKVVTTGLSRERKRKRSRKKSARTHTSCETAALVGDGHCKKGAQRSHRHPRSGAQESRQPHPRGQFFAHNAERHRARNGKRVLEPGDAEEDQGIAPQIAGRHPKQPIGEKREAGSRPNDAEEAPRPTRNPGQHHTARGKWHTEPTPPPAGTASLAIGPTPIKSGTPISAHKAIT